jgi:hypothetical protein
MTVPEESRISRESFFSSETSSTRKSRIAPAGGFLPMAAGAPKLKPRSTRYALPGEKRWSFAFLTESFPCWRGDRSSRIQKERPAVEITRSSIGSCTIRSVTGVTGRLSWRDCQLSPSSKDTNIPSSVPM